MIQQLTEQDLINGLKQTDIQATVKKLYDSCFESIVAQVCTNGGNREDGADIFQEAVIVLIDKVRSGQFRGESSVKTFISAIARNLWLHELRTRSRRSQREIMYMKADATSLHIQRHAAADTDYKALEKIMQETGETCRKILTGFYYENKSMKELLSAFEYENEQVLRNRKSKCMKKLKSLLTGNTTLLNNLKSLFLYESGSQY